MNHMIPIALSINLNVKLCHCRYLFSLVLSEYLARKGQLAADPVSVELRTFKLNDVAKMTENSAEYRALPSSFNKLAEFVPTQIRAAA